MLSLLNAATRESAHVECAFRFGAGTVATARADDGKALPAPEELLRQG